MKSGQGFRAIVERRALPPRLQAVIDDLKLLFRKGGLAGPNALGILPGQPESIVIRF
jgi:hypothetical protein